MRSDDYHAGAQAFAQALGGNVAQVSVMLTYAGAGDYPFQSGKWPSSTEEVWENLKAIEDFPSIAKSNFPEYSLSGQEFRGLDLTDTMFKACQMKDVVFYKCEMKGTDFIDCDMHRSIFRECNLDGCEFSGSVLHNVNFKGSTIKNTEFAMADVGGAYFDIEAVKDKTNNGLKGVKLALSPFRVRKAGK